MHCIRKASPPLSARVSLRQLGIKAGATQALPEKPLHQPMQQQQPGFPMLCCAMLCCCGGLIARHSFEPGDLVLCAPPAAIVQGDADEQPEPEYLVPALLEAARRPHIKAALDCLYSGEGSSQQQQLPAMQVLALDTHHQHSQECCPDHQHEHAHQHSSGHAGPNSSSSGGANNSSGEGGLTLETASQLVRLNAFGDAFEDLAAAAVRGAAMPHSHVGLWPAFSLFNHSCVPNTVHYAVGQQMVVRATEDVPAGHELTVSYLGREDFAPAGARQAVLRERYGFDCDCQRCKLEQQAPEDLQQRVQQTYAQVQQELKPAFLAAVEQQDSSSLHKLHTALLQQEEQMTAALQQQLHKLSSSAVLVLQAAVYDLYELLLFADQLGPGSEAEVAHRSLARLGRCTAIVNCVARGSELQVFLASRLLQHAVDLRGADSVQAEAAAALVQEAHLLRYGQALSQQTLLALMEANKQGAQDFLM